MKNRSRTRRYLTCLIILGGALGAPFAQSQTPTPAPQTECATASTQTRLNECAYEEFLTATAGYAASYKAVSDKLTAPQKAQFRRTQKLWIQYRTEACKFESTGMAGGSAQAMVRSQCDARLTRSRTAELDRLANCPEGDLQCPRFRKINRQRSD